MGPRGSARGPGRDRRRSRRGRVGQSDGRGVPLAARARPSSIESARFAIERQLNERLSRVGRALGLAGTTEGVKIRHWGKMTYISHVPRVRVLHDGKRRPAAPRRSLCSRPGRPRTSYGFQRGPLRLRDVGKPLFAANLASLTRPDSTVMAEGPSPSRGSAPPSGLPTGAIVVAILLAFAGAFQAPGVSSASGPLAFSSASCPVFRPPTFELGSDRPLPPPCPTANPQARTSCPRSRPSPRARCRTPALLLLTP